MAEFPTMPFMTDAYLGDTLHLKTIEHGAYMLLLICMWRSGGELPNDHKLLARYTKLTPGQFKRIWPTLEPFFIVKGNIISQGKLLDNLKAVRQKSKSAKHGARAKWRKIQEMGDANASEAQCGSNAIQNQNQTKKNNKKNDAEFEEWWKGYPRKVGKGHARKAYWSARNKADAEMLASALSKFAAANAGKDQQFICHASTWLNGERWLDHSGADAPRESDPEEIHKLRVERAKEWLSRHDTIPVWMDDMAVADELVRDGFDYDALRKSGFSLPIRGETININDWREKP